MNLERDKNDYLTFKNDEGKIRVFSGIQPSGEVHIGNYLGAISNWVTLLDKYQCIFCIVDHHATTIQYDPHEMPKHIFNAAVANMAAGLDPERCIFFVQSHVPQHTELAWIFNTITPFGDLSRMTQFKQKAREHSDNINVGLFTYPVLQAADILLYKASLVPVGEDQVQHIELAREVARKFNSRFGNVFPECRAKITEAKRIMGLDGESKMSKSLENTIGLLEPPGNIWQKLAPAKTDPRRKRRSDPGIPEDCNIFSSYHRYISPDQDLNWVRKGCTSASIGCLECKKKLADNLEKIIGPIRVKAENLKKSPDYVIDVLNQGARKAREIAEPLMVEVYQAMGLGLSQMMNSFHAKK
ncbi:MAG: tryptophan--tRNA ligase [Candidatus Aminicenantes bacterium]|nr:tryptophan--tRNA ligase [Candidatus Aminicenantes bacterium]